MSLVESVRKRPRKVTSTAIELRKTTGGSRRSNERTAQRERSIFGSDDVATEFRPLDSVKYGVLIGLVGFWVNRAHLRLRASFHRHLADLQLRPVDAAAIIIIGQNKDLSQIVLADALGTDQSTLVSLLLRLERRGLVARKRLAVDRRYQLVNLTRSGQKFAALIEDRLRVHNAKFTEQLTDDDRNCLFKTLKSIVETKRPSQDC